MPLDVASIGKTIDELERVFKVQTLHKLFLTRFGGTNNVNTMASLITYRSLWDYKKHHLVFIGNGNLNY